MPPRTCGTRVLLLSLFAAGTAWAQISPGPPPRSGYPQPEFAQSEHPQSAAAQRHEKSILLTVVDENGLAVPGARVTLTQTDRPPVHLLTDYDGRCRWTPPKAGAFSIRVERPGFYQNTVEDEDTSEPALRIVLTHEQMVQQQVNVQASTPGIDPEAISNRTTMNVAEIVNIPYPTNRDIRNLLPFTPGVIADSSGQVHVAGSETYMTLDTLDGFDIRSPVYGTLDLRVSPDAVRSIDTETTRYPVNYGRSTGGIIAFNTGMGDNKFRYNATDFVPSFRQLNGIHFDKFEPRFTFSGPLRRSRAWFFDGIETEYAENYVTGLPSNADTDPLIRGSNLIKMQENLGRSNSLMEALLFNDYHSEYEGLSTLTPQQSTTSHDILAWLPYARDEQSFGNGIVLDSGFAVMRYREGFEPHGTTPYDLTPESSTGSYFNNNTTRSQRVEGYENIYFPPQHWTGTHQIRAGVDLDHIGYDANETLAPVNYLREDRTLLRQSVFPAFAPFSSHNLEFGAWVEDRWSPGAGLLIEPGLRYDWDEIVRKPLFSPRIAFNWSPPGDENTTKFSAGIGEYYGHTQLEFLTRAQTGVRYDTYYAADGVTPLGPPQKTAFNENDDNLTQARALNWSVGIERRLPWQIYAGAGYLWKRTSDLFVYANRSSPGTLFGTYTLTNNRQDNYHQFQLNARRSFNGRYTLFAAWTHSSARTNAALDYVPTIPVLGPQQSGPLFWDVPNRVISWGWLPAWAPKLPSVRKNWDIVYTLDWHSGFPFDSINAGEQLVGPAGSHRFPSYVNFSPGLEWRFHFHGKYFGLRGVLENATGSADPYVVNNNVDSPQYLTFSQPLGRAFTTRIRLIEASK